METQTLTRAGYQELSQSLKRLEDRRNEIIERMETIDEDEDGTEGPFFQATREREDIEARIIHVREQLANSEVADSDDTDTDAIGVGNRVTVYNKDDGTQHLFDVVGTIEAESPGEATPVTADSPVGEALLGQQIGDHVAVDIPDGEATYRIADIDVMPNPDG
jgi:transcription elongation factor GreA